MARLLNWAGGPCLKELTMFGPILLVACVLLISFGLKARAEGDHLPDPFTLPFPYGKVRLMLRAYVPNNANNLIVDRITVPFNCYIDKVILSHKKFTVVADSISVVTKDAAKNILGAVAPTDDVDAVSQTVHADVANRAYPIDAGDIIYLKATTTTANSGGWINVELVVTPQFAKV